MSLISEDDYQHAQRVWKEFGIRDLGDYHDLYLRTDVVLLANVYEAFRDTCLRHYKLLMSSMAWVKSYYSENCKISINYLFLKHYTHNLVKIQILQI